MGAPVIRRSAAQDELCAMKTLWKAAFHDTDEIINAFFDSLYAPGSAVLALENGETVGCVYLLPGAALVSAAGERLPCAYFYALAVDEVRRGKGLGAALTAYCASLAAQSGEALCLMPGSDGLRHWYSSQGFSDMSTADLQSGDGVDASGKVRVREIDAEAYADAREALLAGTPHAALPTRFFRFQEALCRLSGGALLALTDSEGHSGLVCAEREGAAISAGELLFDGDRHAACADIAAYFGAESCRAFCPGGKLPAVMAHGGASVPGLWWGPTFA